MSKLWYSRRGLFGTINEEQEIHGRQKVVRGLNVPVLTSHAGLNPRSKSGYEPERRVINHYDSHGHDTASYARVYQTRPGLPSGNECCKQPDQYHDDD